MKLLNFFYKNSCFVVFLTLMLI